MKETWDFSRCAAVFTAEIELLKKIYGIHTAVRQGVMGREWTDFNEKNQELNRLGEELTQLEDEREQLLGVLSEGEEKPFNALISDLPMEEGRELSRLYRELKMETLKMQTANETFLVYLNEAKTLANAYLEAACPARGGKLYTRRGQKVSQDLRSLVFNNSF